MMIFLVMLTIILVLTKLVLSKFKVYKIEVGNQIEKKKLKLQNLIMEERISGDDERSQVMGSLQVM